MTNPKAPTRPNPNDTLAAVLTAADAAAAFSRRMFAQEAKPSAPTPSVQAAAISLAGTGLGALALFAAGVALLAYAATVQASTPRGGA